MLDLDPILRILRLRKAKIGVGSKTNQNSYCFSIATRANQKRLRREALSVFKLPFDRFARCIGLRLQSLSTHTPSEAIRKDTERCSATHNELAQLRKRMVGARVTSSLIISDLPEQDLQLEY